MNCWGGGVVVGGPCPPWHRPVDVFLSFMPDLRPSDGGRGSRRGVVRRPGGAVAPRCRAEKVGLQPNYFAEWFPLSQPERATTNERRRNISRGHGSWLWKSRDRRSAGEVAPSRPRRGDLNRDIQFSPGPHLVPSRQLNHG